MVTVTPLKKRREFLAVASTRKKWAAPGLVLQVRRHFADGDAGMNGGLIRVGLTASKKVGSAVVRNRARRRLRALARQVLANHAIPGCDVVLIARADTTTRPFASLRQDLETGLRRLGLWKLES